MTRPESPNRRSLPEVNSGRRVTNSKLVLIVFFSTLLCIGYAIYWLLDSVRL